MPNSSISVSKPFVPSSKLAKGSKALSTATKLVTRAVTSGTVASVQDGGVGKETGIAAGAEILLPIGGKILTSGAKVTGRLLKSLASGLSGSSSQAIESIIANPKVAKGAIKIARIVVNIFIINNIIIYYY